VCLYTDKLKGYRDIWRTNTDADVGRVSKYLFDFLQFFTVCEFYSFSAAVAAVDALSGRILDCSAGVAGCMMSIAAIGWISLLIGYRLYIYKLYWTINRVKREFWEYWP